MTLLNREDLLENVRRLALAAEGDMAIVRFMELDDSEDVTGAVGYIIRSDPRASKSKVRPLPKGAKDTQQL